jgi:hypothetical protein
MKNLALYPKKNASISNESFEDRKSYSREIMSGKIRKLGEKKRRNHS